MWRFTENLSRYLTGVGALIKLGHQSLLRRLTVSGILALAGIIGPVILGVTDVIAAYSEPGYNPISDSISSLVWTPMGWLQVIGFLAIGLLVEVFVAGLFLSIRGAWSFRLGTGLLVCFGFGLLLIGAFRVDPIGSPSTLEGTIHSTTAIAIFIIFPVASLLIALGLKNVLYWNRFFRYTIVTFCLASALAIGWLCIPSEMSWFGLYERILVANTVIWIEVMAVRLLCLSLSRGCEIKKNQAQAANPEQSD